METHREDCEKRAIEYCNLRENQALFNSRLGAGQEGYVWETKNGSAIKVYRPHAQINFNRELRAYSILAPNGATNIDGFEIPERLDFDQLLQVIEMTIVEPPFILDFGKVYFDDRLPDFSL